MLQQVNVAIQVLPSSKEKHPYDLVDKAIEIIAASGLRYRVCPFETVIEGDYDQIMQLVKKIQTELLRNGADKMISFLKIEVNSSKDVQIEDKTGKYD
jgi:uncharacterized protein YqgV (UPF0045/DUF77 family)